MKQSSVFSLILFVNFCVVSPAQETIPHQSPITHQEQSLFTSHLFLPAPLTVSAHKLAKEKGSSLFTLNTGFVQKIYNSNIENFVLSLQKSGEELIELEFALTRVLADNAMIQTSSGTKKLWDNSIKSYVGTIKGKKGWASITFSREDVYLVVADDKGSYEIGPLERKVYIGKYATMKPVRFEEPEFEDQNTEIDVKNQGSGQRYGNCLEVYVECDYQTYLDNGGSLPATNLWITRLMTNVQAVYNLHTVPIVVSGVLIWDTNDPYSGINNLSTMNQTFVNTRQNNYTGRIAILLSTRNLGGGISHGLGGFCNQFPQFPGPFCTNTSLHLDNASFPNYAYNTYLVSHEIGHVMGLRHTHACVWNGNYSQVDDCGNVYAQQNNQTIEGAACFDEDNPILNPGTIMSVCHLLPGVGIDLSQGFGAVVGNRLFENYTFAGCLTGQGCNNQPPPNDYCFNAIPLPVSRNCSLSTFTNFNANVSGATPGFSCGNPGPTIDVWFAVEVPESGDVTIETGQVSSGLTDMIIQVYSGNCNSLVQVACDDNLGNGDHARVVLVNRTPGELLYVRVVDSQSNDYGIFGICAHDINMICHPDFEELINFYNATNGPSWTNKSGWQDGLAGNSCDVCTWFGVICNDDDRVMEIRLPNNNLSGSNIPSTLTNIDLLKALILYDNNLSGTIPVWFENFDFIENIDLGGNDFNGTLPSSLGNIPSLVNLYLDNNNLSGTLLPGLGSQNLSLIYLNNNNFSGCFPTSYTNLCEASYNFLNNTNLPGGGNFDLFCTNGSGGDFDNDGYCKGPEDCDDDDPNTYIGAMEVCDGKDNDCDGTIDEGVMTLTNTWIGSSGNWNVTTNWNLGILPAKCMDVIINTNVTVTVPTGVTGLARSVTTSNNANLVVSTGGILETD